SNAVQVPPCVGFTSGPSAKHVSGPPVPPPSGEPPVPPAPPPPPPSAPPSGMLPSQYGYCPPFESVGARRSVRSRIPLVRVGSWHSVAPSGAQQAASISRQ